MTKFISLIFFLLSTTLAFAGDVVLLTSLKLSRGNVRYLEREFNRTFQRTAYRVVIKHDVQPSDLYATLTSENTEALIWISHAAKDQEVGTGLKGSNIIADKFGNDVKKFFTLVPSNLRFLGIVGCEAKDILEGFKSRGNYADAPDLEIMSFDKKVRMYPSFRSTIRRAKDSLARVKAQRTESEKIDLQLSREAFDQNAGLQSSWIEMGDRVLAFFNKDQVDAETLSVPMNVWNLSAGKNTERNIKFIRAEDALATDTGFGVLSINNAPELGSWKLFANRDGRPIGGRGQQLYVYKIPATN